MIVLFWKVNFLSILGSDQLNKTRDFFHFCKDNVKQLVFADLSDSSNFVISDALELTDKYFKNQILLDKKNI